MTALGLLLFQALKHLMIAVFLAKQTSVKASKAFENILVKQSHKIITFILKLCYFQPSQFQISHVQS